MQNPYAARHDLKDKTFRDPCVFWHAPSHKWVMVLAEPEKFGFYASSDLKVWEYTGSTPPIPDYGVLECPRLRTHSQNMMVAARQMAEKKAVGHLS